MSNIKIYCNSVFLKVSIYTNGKHTITHTFSSKKKARDFTKEYAASERLKSNHVTEYYL